MILTHNLLDIIFPPVCLACKEYLKNGAEKSRRVCDACSVKLDYLPGFLCPICLRRLPTDLPAEVSTKAGVLIRTCRPPCHKNAQFVLASPLDYSNSAVREIIRVLKYDGIRTAAEPLTSVLAGYLSSSFGNYEMKIEDFSLIPVPIHSSKERKRGFNQALVIAEELKKKTNIPVIPEALKKIKATPSQTEKKNNEEREENVRGNFAVKKPELIAGKNIFLVDDVFTSGATMREAVRVLKLAGAGKIIALAVARA
ncbi:MAG: phosphoribosyltransferase family protein [Minisyncoccia bacterium]